MNGHLHIISPIKPLQCNAINILDPQSKPSNLVEALKQGAAARPVKPAHPAPEHFLKRERNEGSDNHGQITNGQLPHIFRQQTPNFDPQRIASVFDVAQHRGYDHDEQPDPEQGEEPAEVVVVGLGVKM